MHWTEPATADASPDCGDMSPLSRRDMSRAKSAVVPAHSGKPDLLNLHVEERVGCTFRFSHLPSLPTSYPILESRTLASLLKTMASIAMDKGEVINTKARVLQARIAENLSELLAA